MKTTVTHYVTYVRLVEGAVILTPKCELIVPLLACISSFGTRTFSFQDFAFLCSFEK